MTASVCMVIVYNHNYEKNYEALQRIYSERFSQILHLIPFTSREEKNIFPVYGNSFFFGNYIAQASQRILSITSDYYFFVADDVLLNPDITEKNFQHFFGVEENRAYLPYFTNLGSLKTFWLRSLDAIIWRPEKRGLEIDQFLPSNELWKKKFLDANISNKISFRSISWVSFQHFLVFTKEEKRIEFRWKAFSSTVFSQFLNIKSIFRWLTRRGRSARPLVGGYVDLFIVPKKYFKEFSKMLGVLSTLDLHVELAIPTSFMLQEGLQFSTNHDLSVMGETQNPLKFWDEKNSRFKFSRKLLYLHPVKLSQGS